jgi:hypothetical protein
MGRLLCWAERRDRIALARKPFDEFAAELAAGIRAGRADESIAETAMMGIVEVAPGDWRLRMVLDHAVEVVADESFSTREEAVDRGWSTASSRAAPKLHGMRDQ